MALVYSTEVPAIDGPTMAPPSGVRFVSLALMEPAADVAPPTFAGAAGVDMETTTSLRVSWLAATDAETAAADMRYFVWWAEGADPDPDVDLPLAMVEGPTLDYTLEGLSPGLTHHVIVRAEDLARNRDTNAAAVTGDTLADTVPPLFDAGTGIQARQLAALPQVIVTWNVPNDGFTDGGDLMYSVYRASTSGAQNFAAPLGTVTGKSFYVDATPLPVGYYVVRAEDLVGNQDTNTTEATCTLVIAPAPDVTPPTLANQLPAPGTLIDERTPLQFDVTDAGGLRRVIVTMRDALDGVEEVVHDGDLFRGLFLGSSTRTVISGGWRYRVLRQGGWKSSPTMRVYALDTSGNESTG